MGVLRQSYDVTNRWQHRQQHLCGFRLSSTRLGSDKERREAASRCPYKLLQRPSRCPLVPSAALAAADAFGQVPSAGTYLQQRLRAVQQSLLSPHDKEIIAVAAPAFLGLALEPVVNAFNVAMVGHLGTLQLSAVSLASVALNSCTFLFSFLIFLTVPEIASAVVNKNADEVSRVTAQSLWVAIGCGVVAAAAVGLGAPSIVAALAPPEPVVVEGATRFLQIRALTIPAVMLGFVSTGVFRGFKDTKTPLMGTAVSVGTSFCLHVLLLNVLHWDVAGAAVAASLASVASAAVMMGALHRRGALRLRDLATPPPLATVLPFLKRGLVLTLRNMVSFGMILYASTLSVRMGSGFQASFEVIRQMWMLTMPFFECLNVATQALCATALGKQDVRTARAVLNRLLSLGLGVGALAGAAVWLLHGPLIGFFTSDAVVVAHVVLALPVVCVFFPIDAAGSILDGSLLAAKKATFMSAVQIAGSAVQYAVLMGIAASGRVDTLSIWVAIKVMSLTRILGGVVGVYMLRSSAYVAPADPPAVATATATTPEAVGSSDSDGRTISNSSNGADGSDGAAPTAAGGSSTDRSGGGSSALLKTASAQ